MNLRQQLQMKRTLRNLRTWAPPIAIGVIVGAGGFMLLAPIDPKPPEAHPTAIEASANLEP